MKAGEVVPLIILIFFEGYLLFMNPPNSSHAEQFNLIKIISLLFTAMHVITTEIGASAKRKTNQIVKNIHFNFRDSWLETLTTAEGEKNEAKTINIKSRNLCFIECFQLVSSTGESSCYHRVSCAL